MINEAAAPMPTHISVSGNRKAHKTRTAKGNKNWVIAKSIVLLPDFPPVTVVTNLNNK